MDISTNFLNDRYLLPKAVIECSVIVFQLPCSMDFAPKISIVAPPFRSLSLLCTVFRASIATVRSVRSLDQIGHTAVRCGQHFFKTLGSTER